MRSNRLTDMWSRHSLYPRTDCSVQKCISFPFPEIFTKITAQGHSRSSPTFSIVRPASYDISILPVTSIVWCRIATDHTPRKTPAKNSRSFTVTDPGPWPTEAVQIDSGKCCRLTRMLERNRQTDRQAEFPTLWQQAGVCCACWAETALKWFCRQMDYRV